MQIKRYLIQLMNHIYSNVEWPVCSPYSIMEQLQVLGCKLNHMDGFAGEEWISHEDAGKDRLYLRKSLSQVGMYIQRQKCNVLDLIVRQKYLYPQILFIYSLHVLQ